LHEKVKLQYAQTKAKPRVLKKTLVNKSTLILRLEERRFWSQNCVEAARSASGVVADA
jgi:hypothetical protein